VVAEGGSLETSKAGLVRAFPTKVRLG
jgi:hypothetical protein